MTYGKNATRRIGWLFVIATGAGVASVLVNSSLFGSDDVLASVRDDQNRLLVGQMLIFVMLAAMVGTAVLLGPILRRHSETLALGYVLARMLEVVTLAIGLVAALLLVPLSWNTAGVTGSERSSANVLAESLEAANEWTGYLGAQMVFSISALVLNWAFFRYDLVPRWLSVWGLIGVPLMFLSGCLVMFESLNSSASTWNLLVVPLAVQEMVMALWLIVRGVADDRHSDAAAPEGRQPAHV